MDESSSLFQWKTDMRAAENPEANDTFGRSRDADRQVAKKSAKAGLKSAEHFFPKHLVAAKLRLKKIHNFPSNIT